MIKLKAIKSIKVYTQYRNNMTRMRGIYAYMRICFLCDWYSIMFVQNGPYRIIQFHPTFITGTKISKVSRDKFISHLLMLLSQNNFSRILSVFKKALRQWHTLTTKKIVCEEKEIIGKCIAVKRHMACTWTQIGKQLKARDVANCKYMCRNNTSA